MSGHIKLGGRPYQLSDTRGITRSNANQVAGKIGSSAGDYDDLQNWSAWVMDDWRAGVGKKDPEAGGFRFSTLDSRNANQLLPSPRLFFSGTSTSATGFASVGALLIGANESVQRVAYGPQTNNSNLTVLLPGAGYVGTATQAKVELWTTTGTVPNALVESKTVNLRSQPGFHFHYLDFTASGNYHVVVYPASGDIYLPGRANASGAQNFNGSTWTTLGFSIVANFHNQASLPGSISKMTVFNNVIYLASTTTLWKLSSGNFTSIKTYGANITDLVSTNDTLYVAVGNSTNYERMNAAESFTDSGFAAEKMLFWNGYLWRSLGTSVFYTNNETDWSEVDVADPGTSILALGSHTNNLIVSTNTALIRVAPGDVVLTLTRWGDKSPENGKYMLNWQGDLYISGGQSLWRYDGAALLPVGPDLDEGLPPNYIGFVAGLAGNNNWLVCAIQHQTNLNSLYSSVWVYNRNGWHHIASLPVGTSATALAYAYYGFGSSNHAFGNSIVIGTNVGVIGYCQFFDTAKSNYQLANNQLVFFMFSGILETDWFFGRLREVYKDIESVYIDGEGLSPKTGVDVYWQDEQSTDWEFLGRVDFSGGKELRFSDYSIRPNSRRLKLRICIYYLADTLTTELRINAIRVKYRPMIVDRWRWQFSIVIPEGSRQQQIDGTAQDIYTQAEQLAHLDGLTKQVPPFIFEDTDGASYEVMVLSTNRQMSEYEYLPGSGLTRKEYIYNFTIEQVQGNPYTTVAPPVVVISATPDQLNGLWGWWDFSDATTMFTTSGGSTNVASNNDPIGRIEDKSGNGHHLTQATSANRPYYKPAVQNGLSAALFAADGGVDFLATSATISTTNSTIVVVLRTPSVITPGTSYGIWSSYHSGLQDGGNVRLSDTGYFTARTRPPDAEIIDPNPPATNTNHIIAYTVRSDSPERRMLIRGTGYVATGPPDSDDRIIRLGVQNTNNPNHHWTGHIMEMIAYEDALSDEDVDRLIVYLQTKWAIS